MVNDDIFSSPAEKRGRIEVCLCFFSYYRHCLKLEGFFKKYLYNWVYSFV